MSLETGVSVAIVRATARDLGKTQDELGIQRKPWLPGYAIRILDGNCLEASEKRLAVHRGADGEALSGEALSGEALSGESLVVTGQGRRWLVDVFPCDGAADFDKTSGPPATRGSSHIVCSFGVMRH